MLAVEILLTYLDLGETVDKLGSFWIHFNQINFSCTSNKINEINSMENKCVPDAFLDILHT
jgi:hypothetical protein